MASKIAEYETNLTKFKDLSEIKEKKQYLNGIITELVTNVEVIFQANNESVILIFSFLTFRRSSKLDRVLRN